MRAAAIFGLGSSVGDLKPFQEKSNTEWLVGVPECSAAADAVLVFGGDGTVHRHLPQLIELQLPVLVVPTGSGNDFARALNLRSVRHSLAAWQEFSSGGGKVRRIDLGLIQPLTADGMHPSTQASLGSPSSGARYYCCVAGCGLDSAITRLANRLPRWLRARGGYALALPAALAGFVPPTIKLAPPQSENDDQPVTYGRQPATLVAFANAPTYGHGMRIAPRATLDDGKLDICVVGDVGKLRLLRLFPTVYSGRHLAIPEVKYFQAERLRIETDPPLDIYADGEYVCQTPADIEVAPAALQVIGFTVLH